MFDLGGNALEEAAQRYWKASRIWRDLEDSQGMTVEDMINECNSLRCYRGIVPHLAGVLLNEVVHNLAPHPVDSAAECDITPFTIDFGQ